jgi:ABC-2 type transport system permease protein
MEVFPPAMSAVAHLTPHYWAVRSWQELVFHNAGVAAIAPSLLVLLLFAVALILTATACSTAT